MITLFGQAIPAVSSVAIILGIAFLVFLFIVGFAIFSFLRDWARAFFSGAQISLMDIVGMRLRKTNANVLITCRIMSVQAGIPIHMRELESAYLSGADVTTVTLAYIDAHKSGKEFSFEELVDANRSERLAEILNMKRPT